MTEVAELAKGSFLDKEVLSIPLNALNIHIFNIKKLKKIYISKKPSQQPDRRSLREVLAAKQQDFAPQRGRLAAAPLRSLSAQLQPQLRGCLAPLFPSAAFLTPRGQSGRQRRPRTTLGAELPNVIPALTGGL